MFRHIARKDKTATLTVRATRESGFRSLLLLVPQRREGM